MSTHYYVYAEIKVNNKWYNFNPTMKKFDGTFVIQPIYDARSSFYEICMLLEEKMIGVGIPDDMSSELRSLFHDDLDDKCDEWFSEMKWRKYYEQSVFYVRYSNTIGERIIKDKPHKFEGYVRKRLIADFEANEIEEIGDWLTHEEYMALSEKEKMKYRFYQWDEPYDEYFVYRTIFERLNAMMYWFDFADAFESKGEYWRTDTGLSDVRLFIQRC